MDVLVGQYFLTFLSTLPGHGGFQTADLLGQECLHQFDSDRNDIVFFLHIQYVRSSFILFFSLNPLGRTKLADDGDLAPI